MKTRAQRARERSTSPDVQLVFEKKSKNQSKQGKKKAKGKQKQRTPSPPPSPSPPKKQGKKQLKRKASRDSDDSSAGRGRKRAKMQSPIRKDKQSKDKKKEEEGERSAKKPRRSRRDREQSPSPKQQKKKEKRTKEDKQMKKLVVKGKVPVDEIFQKYHPGKKVHVLQEEKLYSVTLNQTSMQKNSNKFYIIQVLEEDNSKTCYCWTRWARVGYEGQYNLFGPTTKQAAIREYEKKFVDKHIKGQYRQVSLSYDNDDEKEETQPQPQPQKQRAKDFEQSQLQKSVKQLIKLIFDMNMIERQMKEIGYDAKKMPLGKLSNESITQGFRILQKLSDAIKKGDDSAITRLNDDFYSHIPHDFKFQSTRTFLIDSQKKLKDKLQLLDSLREIKVATKMLSEGEKDKDVNQIDANYAKLNREIKCVRANSSQFQIIQEYVKNTHADTHRTYTLEILDVFKLSSENENKRFKEQIGNKMLLWHGSRLTNYVGILSQGLRIAPPEAPVTGYMFGKGVYFADMVSKSANYCFTNPNNNIGLMLLCEVALGDMHELQHADSNAANLPPGKKSTKGLGKSFPPQQSYVDLNGFKVPLGKPEKKGASDLTLLYNEYIVYDVAQVRLKYLLKMKFNYKY